MSFKVIVRYKYEGKGRAFVRTEFSTPEPGKPRKLIGVVRQRPGRGEPTRFPSHQSAGEFAEKLKRAFPRIEDAYVAKIRS